MPPLWSSYCFLDFIDLVNLNCLNLQFAPLPQVAAGLAAVRTPEALQARKFPVLSA
jgi:hypothetical protein